jgi:phosphomevalonate kinase
MIEAQAPGKLLISGEYAVLQGAPAIAMAVNVQAQARIRPAAGASRLAVPEAGSWAFQWQADGQPQWLDLPDAGQGRVLEAILATLATRRLLPAALPALDIELDSRAFQHRRPDGSRQKLGLGSSAAITVAAARALLAALGQGDAPLLDICGDAHRRLQGGAGSGIDVMVAVHGGVVGVDHTGSVLQLAWPEGLHWLAAWSGRAASTPELIARFTAFATGQPGEFQRQLQKLDQRARAVLENWQQRKVERILVAIDAYGTALRELDAAARIGIWTPEHERLSAIAREAGAVYKTSGAGGGDFGMALAADADKICQLKGRFDARGVLTLTGEPPLTARDWPAR